MSLLRLAEVEDLLVSTEVSADLPQAAGGGQQAIAPPAGSTTFRQQLERAKFLLQVVDLHGGKSIWCPSPHNKKGEGGSSEGREASSGSGGSSEKPTGGIGLNRQYSKSSTFIVEPQSGALPIHMVLLSLLCREEGMAHDRRDVKLAMSLIFMVSLQPIEMTRCPSLRYFVPMGILSTFRQETTSRSGSRVLSPTTAGGADASLFLREGTEGEGGAGDLGASSPATSTAGSPFLGLARTESSVFELDTALVPPHFCHALVSPETMRLVQGDYDAAFCFNPQHSCSSFEALTTTPTTADLTDGNSSETKKEGRRTLHKNQSCNLMIAGVLGNLVSLDGCFRQNFIIPGRPKFHSRGGLSAPRLGERDKNAEERRRQVRNGEADLPTELTIFLEGALMGDRLDCIAFLDSIIVRGRIPSHARNHRVANFGSQLFPRTTDNRGPPCRGCRSLDIVAALALSERFADQSIFLGRMLFKWSEASYFLWAAIRYAAWEVAHWCCTSTYLPVVTTQTQCLDGEDSGNWTTTTKHYRGRRRVKCTQSPLHRGGPLLDAGSFPCDVLQAASEEELILWQSTVSKWTVKEGPYRAATLNALEHELEDFRSKVQAKAK